eukprot:jgi/Tetstr1/424303/TSEL_014870.t2
MMEEVQDRLSSVEDAVNKQPEWFATYKKRVVDLADRFDRMDSRLVQVEAGPNGLKSKVAKTDVDLTAVEQLPRLMIQMMETQAKIEIHSNGMSAVEKSMAKMSQEVQNLRSELKSGSSSQTKQPSAQVPIPLPLSSVLKESQLGNERTGEYQEAVEQFKQRVEELMRVESRVMRSNEFGSKADTAVALARKAGRSGMDAQRLIEEQREKGHTLAAKIETAWSKVEKHEVSLLGCVTRIELEKDIGKVQEHLEFVTRQVMEVQQVMDMVASKEDILQTRAQMAEVEQQLGDLDRRLTGRSVTEMDVRHTIETALDTFEDRLKAAEGRGAKAEAHMRQASTKTSQADDRIQELSTHITALRRKLVDMESELNVKGGPHDQRHEADSSENSAIDQESSSKDLATIVNADTLLELVRLSESSMTAMADMENRMKALQETISVKADRNDVTLLNKSLMSIQQDTLQVTAKHVEGIMLQAQQERGKQSDMMQHSLQSLRVDIGQLLQEMIVDDDSQHKKLKEVLQEMLALKAAANDSKSEVESLRRAKFRTPIQLLFPDQFDGGSMITSVKMWSEQEIESLNKQMVSIRNTLSMKTNHEELAKTERVIASSETLKRDVALVRNHLNTELVKVTVDTAQAIRDMEQCQRFVKDVSAGVANLKRTVPQAVAVLRNAIKDMKSQAAAKDAEIESAILSYSGRLQVLEKRSTEEGSSGASSGSRSEATKPTPDKLNHLENDMASILHRMAMVEKAVSSLFQGVSQTGQAVASVAESLHATDYQNDRFSAILQQLIDEDEGEGADQDGNMGQEMQVNSKNGSVRGADPQPRGQTPSTKQAVSLQGIEEWTMPNLALTKRVPQKANASWVLKLEGAISQRLEELDQRLHAVETTFSNLWQRKVDRSELQGLQRVIAQQRSDTGRLKDIVADGLSGARSGSPVYIPDVLTKFPGGFGKQKEQKGHRGASTAPSSPTPTLMSERQAPPSISRKLVQDVPTGEEDRMGSPVPIARRFWDRGATAPGVGIGRDAGRVARSLPLMPKSMPQ